jgi:hypothetical protein
VLTRKVRTLPSINLIDASVTIQALATRDAKERAQEDQEPRPLSHQSQRAQRAQKDQGQSTLGHLSPPRVYRYIGTLMEQPQGLSMVNSSLLN